MLWLLLFLIQESVHLCFIFVLNAALGMHKVCKFFGIGLHFTNPTTMSHHHTPPPCPMQRFCPLKQVLSSSCVLLPVQVLLTGSSPLVQSSGRLLVRGGAGVEVAAAQNITLRSTTGGIHFTAHKLQPDVVCMHVFKVGLIVEGHGVEISVGSCFT